jgi:hypothetical protein
VAAGDVCAIDREWAKTGSGGYVAARSHNVAVIRSAAERNIGFRETGHPLSPQRESERERVLGGG